MYIKINWRRTLPKNGKEEKNGGIDVRIAWRSCSVAKAHTKMQRTPRDELIEELNRVLFVYMPTSLPGRFFSFFFPLCASFSRIQKKELFVLELNFRCLAGFSLTLRFFHFFYIIFLFYYFTPIVIFKCSYLNCLNCYGFTATLRLREEIEVEEKKEEKNILQKNGEVKRNVQ